MTPNSKPRGPVPRWVHGGAGGDVDAELVDAFRLVEREEPMSDVALARVGRRLASSKRRSRPLLRLLPVVLAVLTGSAGAALAQWLRPGIWDLQRPLVSRAEAEKAPPPSAPKPAPPSREPTVAAPALPEPPPESPTATPEPAGARPAPGGPASGASGLALESELLQRALERLRRAHDGAGALRLLDEHRARFPSGVLALEAAVARVDALLLLGRRGEALEQLARLPLARVGRRAELQLLRGELYAERDCNKALADFDAVLAGSAPVTLAERALYGRATCRLRSGDDAAARVDLRAYLSRFPNGRFAEQVRERLEL